VSGAERRGEEQSREGSKPSGKNLINSLKFYLDLIFQITSIIIRLSTRRLKKGF
jgi:hypothetical protein